MRKIAMAVFLFVFAGMAVTADAAKSTKPQKESKAPPLERFTCRTGPNDHQARLIAEVVKGRPMEFAFYSRLGTRVCSVHGRRGDAYSNWEDAEGGKTAIKLFQGNAEVEYKPGYLKVVFADVGRMHYCGMYGKLNGAVEVTAKQTECGLEGVFELGTED